MADLPSAYSESAVSRHSPSPYADAGFDIRVASGRQELAGAYELVYRSYVDQGYVEHRPGGMVYQERFGSSSARTIVASRNAGGIVGTLSVVGDGPMGLQLEAGFSKEVDSLRRRGRRLSEITCLAIERTRGLPAGALFFALTKFMLHHARGREYDDLLMAIHPKHYRFYWRHYRVYPEGSCPRYACAAGNPAVCCRIDLHHLKRNMPPKVRDYYYSGLLPAARYQGPEVSPADHEYFCRRSGISTRPDGRLPRIADVA